MIMTGFQEWNMKVNITKKKKTRIILKMTRSFQCENVKDRKPSNRNIGDYNEKTNIHASF